MCLYTVSFSLADSDYTINGKCQKTENRLLYFIIQVASRFILRVYSLLKLLCLPLPTTKGARFKTLFKSYK